MQTKIKIESSRHLKVPVADILPNPHRDLKTNPIVPEKVEDLLKSFAATGFWDNIIVRRHPTREGKFQQAHGHTRVAALKDKRVEVDTITIPVVDLTDWEMYEAMVTENELGARVTPTLAIENVKVGCELIERALKKIGKNGTWDEFNEAIGRTSVTTVTKVDREKHDGGFEMIRNAYFNGEGLGRRFLVGFLPCGNMRDATIQEIVAARYGDAKAAVKAAEAKRLMDEAMAAAKADEHEKAKKLKAKSDKAAEEATQFGKNFSEDILRKFERARTATDFCKAARDLNIPKPYHERAADFIVNGYDGEGFTGERKIAQALKTWWDDAQEGETFAPKPRPKRGEAAPPDDPNLLIDELQFSSDLGQISYLLKKMRKTIEPHGVMPSAWVNATVEEMVEVQNQLKELLEYVRRGSANKRAHLHAVEN